ncbi:MAG: shikimate kinase [Nitrososphaeraceae archaeon]|nr:shikimate kinase [Nitrososphaeraceae archaeon]
MKLISRASLHGAVSIVNAIATGNGCALGISLSVKAEIECNLGSGMVTLKDHDKNSFIEYVVRNSVPSSFFQKHDFLVKVISEIPSGFGLKSSSAVSNAVSLACYGIPISPDNSEIDFTKVDEPCMIDDFKVLSAAVSASRQAGVTITGAYDDATACYFGGFVITKNFLNFLVKREESDENLYAVILIPQHKSRSENIQNLKILKSLFDELFQIANKGSYWNAMNMNGILIASLLYQDKLPLLMTTIENGAIGTSISGNGPAIVAIVDNERLSNITTIYDEYGKVLISKISNQKAKVERSVG